MKARMLQKLREFAALLVALTLVVIILSICWFLVQAYSDWQVNWMINHNRM